MYFRKGMRKKETELPFHAEFQAEPFAGKSKPKCEKSGSEQAKPKSEPKSEHAESDAKPSNSAVSK